MSDAPAIKAIIVLDGSGKRLVAKYYSKTEFPTKARQLEVEDALFQKTRNATSSRECEVTTLDPFVCVYRYGSNVTFYVLGANDENELILAAVLDGLYDAVMALLKVTDLDARVIMQHVELLLLTIDELVDGGVILETEPASIRDRVLLKGAVPESLSSYSEMTVASALATAREQVARALLK